MYKKMDFTYNKIEYNGLPDFVQGLNAQGQKYIVIIVSSFHLKYQDYLNRKKGRN